MRPCIRVFLSTAALLLAGCPAAAAPASAPAPAASGPPAAPRTLRIATWDIYCDPLHPGKPLGWKEFEAETGVALEATLFSTNDDILRAMRAGSFDLCITGCDMAPVLIAEGLVLPLPTARLRNYADLLPGLRHVRYGLREGKDYCVPFTWGVMALAYDTSAFPTPPRSWQELWDPAYRGKVAHWDDISVLWTAALAAGHRDVFSLQGQSLGEAGRWAARFCESGALLWRDEKSMLEAMASGRVVLNVTWPNAVANANRQVGRRSGTWATACPVEGVTAFIDNLCVAVGCRDPKAAEAYCDLAIGPQVQLALQKTLDFSPVSAAAAELLSPERRAQLHLDDPNFLNRVFLWRPIPNRAEYERTWNDARLGRLIQ